MGRTRYRAGDRVKLKGMFKGDPYDGVIGVIVKVTHGHRLNKVWLDKPVKTRIGGANYLAHCSDHEIEGRTTEGERFVVVPPTWKTEAAFYSMLRHGEFEIVERETGKSVGTRRSALRAHAFRDRHSFVTKNAERREASHA